MLYKSNGNQTIDLNEMNSPVDSFQLAGGFRIFVGRN